MASSLGSHCLLQANLHRLVDNTTLLLKLRKSVIMICTSHQAKVSPYPHDMQTHHWFARQNSPVCLLVGTVTAPVSTLTAFKATACILLATAYTVPRRSNEDTAALTTTATAAASAGPIRARCQRITVGAPAAPASPATA